MSRKRIKIRLTLRHKKPPFGVPQDRLEERYQTKHYVFSSTMYKSPDDAKKRVIAVLQKMHPDYNIEVTSWGERL